MPILARTTPRLDAERTPELPADVQRRLAHAAISVVECGDLYTGAWEIRKVMVAVLGVLARRHAKSDADRNALYRAAEIVAGVP